MVPLIEPFIGLAPNMWVEAFKRVFPTTPDWVSLTLFWGLPPLMLVGLGVYLDRFFRKPGRTVWRIAVPCLLTALCTLFLSSTIPLALAQAEGAQHIQSGQGGSGGNVGSVSGERLHIVTGKGGAGGCGGVGGAGGGAGDVNGKDISVLTGQGGDAAGCDGRGARRTPGGAELQGWPTQFWTFGYGGPGAADAPAYTHRIAVLTRIRQEYMKAFPFEVKYIDAGVQQVPLNWVNKRLEELSESWHVTQGELATYSHVLMSRPLDSAHSSIDDAGIRARPAF
jgi:hypothetical protein